MTRLLSRRGNRARPTKEWMAGISAAVGRTTSTWEGGPVRIRWNELADDEAIDLADLVDRCANGLGFDPSKLKRRDRVRLEDLLEKASTLGAGYFEQRREDAKLGRELAGLAEKARRPPRRPRWEEPGAVVLAREWILDFLNRGELDVILHLTDLGVLVFLLAQLENGVALSPGARFESSGDDLTLVLSVSFGLGLKFDPDGAVTGRWLETVEHLAANDLLEIDRRGNELRVKRGLRVREVAMGRAA